MFGNKLRKLRDESKKPLRWLSERTGYSVSYLSDLEHNRKTNPSKEVIEKIAAAFNIVPSFFYEDEGEPVPLDYFAKHLPDDIKDWLNEEKSRPYVVLAKELSESDLTEEDIKDLVKFIRRHIDK